jgi:hypothetical protein
MSPRSISLGLAAAAASFVALAPDFFHGARTDEPGSPSTAPPAYVRRPGSA